MSTSCAAASAFAQALHPQRTSAVAQAETLIEEMADHDRALSFGDPAKRQEET